eukprot:25692-Chlamydomonas_euryale.AAC.2
MHVRSHLQAGLQASLQAGLRLGLQAGFQACLQADATSSSNKWTKTMRRSTSLFMYGVCTNVGMPVFVCIIQRTCSHNAAELPAFPCFA